MTRSEATRGRLAEEDGRPTGKAPAKVRSLLPGLGAILFAAQLNLMFVRAADFLDDPGTGWHLRAGGLILGEGRWIRADPFSFTHGGETWITFEWLSEVILAAVEHAAGLGGVVWIGFSLLAFVPLLLFRWIAANGLPHVVAFAYAVVALIVLQKHALARPHLFTYLAMTLLFLAVGPRMREGPSRRQGVALAALFAVWANLHAGFAAGLLWLGARAAGFSIDRAREGGRAGIAHGWWAVLAASAAATLANPHGWRLHEKVGETVFALESVRHWEEFMPPDFYAPSLLAAVVLAVVFVHLIALATGRLATPRAEELVPFLVFLFFAFKSQRHVFLLLLVAAVPTCRALLALAPRIPEAWLRIGRRLDAIGGRTRGDAWAAPVLVILFGGAFFASGASAGLRVGATSLSAAAADTIGRDLPSFRRPLTTTSTGGPLLYYFFPRLRVSFDDRSDFYGDVENFRYLHLLHMRPGWREMLTANRFDSAILPPDLPIAEALRLLPDWREVHRDATVAIFLRDEHDEIDGRERSPV